MLRKNRLLLPARRLSFAGRSIRGKLHSPLITARPISVTCSRACSPDMKEFIGTQNELMLVLAVRVRAVMEASVSEPDLTGRQNSRAYSREVRRTLDGAGKRIRLQRGCAEQAVQAKHLHSTKFARSLHPTCALLRAGDRNLDRRPPRCERDRQARSRPRGRDAPRGRRHHRTQYNSSRRRRLECRHHRRRLAEGADDPSRPRLLRG